MRKSDWAKWLIVIPAMLGIVVGNLCGSYNRYLGFGAFICQLIAILELAYGMRIAMLAQSRKKSYRLTPEERHEYAQYLYEKQYQRYPAVANQMLLVMARMSILLDNYERATQELEDICIDKFNPAQLKVYYYLKVVTAVVAGDTEGLQREPDALCRDSDTKCVYPPEAELAEWIEQRDTVQMAEALKR